MRWLTMGPMTEEPQVTVTDNPEKSRFEVSVDGTLAGFAAYKTDPGVVIFVHTEVFPEYEGNGLAGQLAKAALAMVREAGNRIVPICPYIRSYVRRHAPEYDDLLLQPVAG
jgi:predicted GNAT family acetyltransferase